jgi:ADP-heptose:LPS heptosyltransferase
VLTLHAWTEKLLQNFAPETVLNLTAGKPARLLARRLAGNGKIRGFGMDDHGFGTSGSAWTIFFEGSTRRRGCSPYNIVDLFLRASGLRAPAAHRLRRPDADQSLAAAQSLRQSLCPHNPNQDAPACSAYVAFQLGASEARRQWPAEQFALLGRRLREEGLMPVLLGTQGERNLAERYLAAGGPGIDRVGRTSLPELAAILRQARLLVSNDTGTLHLAAGLGIPCLALFLATAQPWDTGPYLEGCCSLEPALPCHPCAFGSSCDQGERCVSHIAAEAVWPLLASYLHDGIWTCPPDTAAKARVWLSVRDGQGYMDLRSLSGHDAEDRSLWIRLQRHIYRQLLDKTDGSLQPPDAEPPDNPPEAALAAMPDVQGSAAALSPQRRAQERLILDQADALLHLFQEQGRLTMMRPAGPHGRQFLATCQRLENLFDGQDSFNALGWLWKNIAQERADDLHKLLAFGDLLRRTLGAWRAVLAE